MISKRAMMQMMNFIIVVVSIFLVLLISLIFYRTLDVTVSESQYIDMVNKIEVEVDSLLYQTYGTSEEIYFNTPKNTEKICFVDYDVANLFANIGDENAKEIANRIKTSELSPKPNVIILNSKENKYTTLYAGPITVYPSDEIYCIIVQGKLNLELKNIGKKILVNEK